MPNEATGFHLAQVNVGRLVAPLASAEIADFVAQLEPINALADGSPGFVWRLQSEAGDATDYRALDDDSILVNLSVWRSLEELRDFVYRTGHVDVLRRRREWFEKLAEAHLALWWLPAGRLPTIAEADAKIRLLREQGPTPEAFTFRTPFGPPEASRRRGPAVGAEFCLPLAQPPVTTTSRSIADSAPQTSPGRPWSCRTAAPALGRAAEANVSVAGSKRTIVFAPKSVNQTASRSSTKTA
jgi:hypothetical protein